MSMQSGGTGYGKFRKSCQSGGASGWAKHCGNTTDHKMSNRVERKNRASFDDESPRPGPWRRKRDRKPTRRHLLDKLRHVDKQIADRRRSIDAHKERLDGLECNCYLYCKPDYWLDIWLIDERKKILKGFAKHGYAAP